MSDEKYKDHYVLTDCVPAKNFFHEAMKMADLCSTLSNFLQTD